MIRLGVFLDGIEALAFFHVPITPCFVIGLKILIRLAQYCEQQFPSLQCVWMACSAGLFLSFSPVAVLNGMLGKLATVAGFNHSVSNAPHFSAMATGWDMPLPSALRKASTFVLSSPNTLTPITRSPFA